MKRILKNKKNVVIALLGILCLLMVPGEGLPFFLWVILGVLVCSGWDYLLSLSILKRKVLPKSAIVTGLIIAGIIDYRQPFWLLLIFCTLAISSKYIVKFKKKHIFNPAVFALFFATIFKVPLTWHIESNIFLIIPVGAYLAYSFKKIPHILGFLSFFMILFLIEKINPLMLISWFFLFIMLIEPKTSGYGRLRGFFFGSVAGIISFTTFKVFPGYDFFVISLFSANAFNPVFDIVTLLMKRRKINVTENNS